MKKGLNVILLMLASAVGMNAYAQKPAVVTDNEEGWTKIGETTASFKMQNESIVVYGADEFTAIKLKIKDAPLNIQRLQVFYESGEMEELKVSENLSNDNETQAIKLSHPDRDIQKVAFTYQTEENAEGEKAEVELYGLKTGQPMGSDAYRNDVDNAEGELEHAAENTERDVENAANELGEDAEELGHDAEREANEASNELREEADQAEQELSEEGEEAEREIDQAAENTKRDVKEAGDDVGDAVAEGTGDAVSAIKDEKVDGQVGPNGETCYIDDDGKYYYISNEGKRVDILKSQLKDKPDND